MVKNIAKSVDKIRTSKLVTVSTTSFASAPEINVEISNVSTEAPVDIQIEAPLDIQIEAPVDIQIREPPP